MTSPAALKRITFGLGALLVLALVVAGCGGSSGGGGTKIALLLPENETPRYETNDRPDFEKAVEELCGDCEVLYSNAGGDAAKAAEPGRSGADPGRRSARRRPDGREIGRRRSPKRRRPRTCRWSATTA